MMSSSLDPCTDISVGISLGIVHAFTCEQEDEAFTYVHTRGLTSVFQFEVFSSCVLPQRVPARDSEE